MAEKSVLHCTCPRCNATGRSVGAMNYAETKVWDKTGSFSGSGIGIGSGGIGVGMGGGTYSEHGQIASKRAAAFDEPQPFHLPILPVFGFMLFAALAYSVGPDFMSTIFQIDGGSGSGSDMTQLAEKLASFLKAVGGIVGVILVGLALRYLFRTTNEENRLNKEVYPKRLARYQELQYCTNCHTIFDARGNAADANENGFDAMMRIDPAHTSNR
jgi:hypothetical protein